jgi:glycosyltransferase involved in cell wall biosynthesis
MNNIKIQQKKKVLIALNTAWNLVNFRSGLIKSLVEQGFDVIAAATDDSYAHLLDEFGCRFIPIKIDSHGKHIGHDTVLLFRFLSLMIHEKPDIFLGFTIKPNIYGSIAAHFLKIPVINNIAGLGAVFGRENITMHIVCWLYKLALLKSKTVFFQNDDDRQYFIKNNVVSADKADLLPGSGIDLKKYLYSDNYDVSKNILCDQNKKFRFLLIARMLWDKGIGEYVAASKLIRKRFPNVEFCLLGFIDEKNNGAISHAQMDEFISQGVLYHGVSNDVRYEIDKSDCIVLPSYYREGTPHALLEAAAMGRPIITTDSVGCREVVDDGFNGYLCKVMDFTDLAEKMDKMLQLSAEERRRMGIYGRLKMEREFDEKIVISKYLSAIYSL